VLGFQSNESSTSTGIFSSAFSNFTGVAIELEIVGLNSSKNQQRFKEKKETKKLSDFILEEVIPLDLLNSHRYSKIANS
jgi:hypothetical protein